MMNRILAFVFGLAAYIVFLGTFLYAIGFVAGVVVPKSIDTGPVMPVLQSVVINLLLLTLFAVQHSVMARKPFKRWWTRFIPKAIERSMYVLLASLALILLFWLWQPIHTVVWRVTDPATEAVLFGLSLFGWVIVLFSTFLINHFELFGLRQVMNESAARSVPAPTFRTPLLYNLVRHPIYLGFIIAFWATPIMTCGHLLFATATTAYILIGIALEERDLIEAFGDEYRRYRRRVGMLLPRRPRATPALAGDRALETNGRPGVISRLPARGREVPSLGVERGLTSTARSHLSGGIILTLAFGCGLLVANLYFGQPLAAPISASTGLPPSLAGVPVTLTQAGYAIALLLLAPLGDICETRAVVVPIVLIGLLALVAAALSSSPGPFLVSSLGIGICPVGGQILLPYAARLAPEHERGHVVGKVMSGLLLGIMLSRPMGSFVASVAGWRAIYWLIAAGEAVLAVLLLKMLPSLRPQTSLSYTALLRSLLPIWRNHAELRYRAVIHAGLLAAFILFWTAAPLHLARDFGLGQQAIGLFALAGVSGACVAPFVGRIADAGHRQPRIARAAQLVALTTAVIPFVISFFGHRIWAVGLLACAGIVLDAAVTANMILTQRAIFSLGDDIRTRVNALYMASIFLAGACGSALGGWGIATGGWPLAAAFGIALTGGSLLFALLSRHASAGRV